MATIIENMGALITAHKNGDEEAVRELAYELEIAGLKVKIPKSENKIPEPQPKPVSSPVMAMFFALSELYKNGNITNCDGEKESDPSYEQAKRLIMKAIKTTGYAVATCEGKVFLISDEEDLGGKIEIVDKFAY